MEDQQCSPLSLSWAYYYHQEELGVDELKQSLLYSTLELEAAVISAHEEISRRDDEIAQLKGLLSRIIKERDEFQAQSQELVLEKQLLFQAQHRLDTSCPISSGTTSNEDASDCDDNNNNNNANAVVVAITTTDTTPVPLIKPLPEQGKFLQAVMEAGPLLQTLLLAGPLPRWQHPPPQINSIDIPPVTILNQDSNNNNNCIVNSPTTTTAAATKRAITDASESSPTSKYQKV